MSIDTVAMQRWCAAMAWPSCVLNATVSFNPRPISRSGGMTMGGSEPVVFTGAGYWVASIGLTLAKENRLTLWRGMQARLRGRAGVLRVPAYLSEVPAWATAAEIAAGDLRLAGRRVTEKVPHSDAAPFSDGSGYVGSRWRVMLHADAPAQSESIVINVLPGDVPLPGCLVSLWGDLHRLTDIHATGTADRYEVSIWPPLRRTWSAGARLEADRPECLMRLVSDEEGQAGARDLSLTLSLREAV